MSKYKIRFKPFGDSALLIEWQAEINEKILNDIRIVAQKIEHFAIKGVIDVNYAYHSMLITYNKDILVEKDLCNIVNSIYLEENLEELDKQNIWHIPVCYDFGIDLNNILKEKKLSNEEFISIHSSPFYTVYGIGFLPGFLYLGGLNKKLITPRKEIPRINVFKGAVAIGGSQTGIYPQDSPGGWHIVGKTPISLFDTNKKNPLFVKPGDKIKFYSVSKSKFELLEIEIKTEVYDFNKLVYDSSN